PEPVDKHSAFLKSAETGGIFVMNVNDRSSKTVITAGMIIPGSFVLVFSLNCLQKSIMFTPCWPRAGPTGGAGFAAPAGICSLICVLTFFAMGLYLPPRIRRNSRTSAPAARKSTNSFQNGGRSDPKTNFVNCAEKRSGQ